MAASDSPSTVQWSQLGCLFFDFAPTRVFDFDQKFSRNVAQVILYYHVTKQFLACLSWLATCFWFQNMFWKNINRFRFWWKTYTERCTSNYVILRVKRLSSPALCGWSGAFNFRVWFGKRRMRGKQKYCIKTWRWKSRFWFCSTFVLLCLLKNHFLCVLFCLCCSYKLF